MELGHGGIEAGPAFLAFSRTENWGAYDHTTPTGPGHPNWGLPDSGGRTGGPLPDSFVHDQWVMQKKIVARQRELGIGSVVVLFWKSTHDNVTTEIIFRGRAFAGPNMHDGFIQGRTLSKKALLLTVEIALLCSSP